MNRTTVRFGLGITAVAAMVLTVLAVSSLSWTGHGAGAQEPLLIKHVNPDGSDFIGNPFCPPTVWSADGQARVVSVADWQDCNNAIGQLHLIRTVGFDPATMTVVQFNLQGVGGIVGPGTGIRCGDLLEAVDRPNWNPANNDQQCVVIHSSDPGETLVTLTYDDGGILSTTESAAKQWDTLTDTVILKAGDVESVTVPGMGAQKLPKDVDGDGDRDAADEHLLDHNGETQQHAVVFDEALKRLRSAEGPVQLIESPHGQHVGLADHPAEGAVILAFIDSPHGCTYFTSPSDPLSSLGTAVVGIADWRGFFVGPKVWPAGAQFDAEALAEAAAAGLAPGLSNNGDDIDFPEDFEANFLGVHVDSLCEELATITFKVGYPNFVASMPLMPAPEWVTINWTTIEMAKQPQIRWAGEEIVLEKRWALPGEWYPEPGAGIDNDGDGLINEDPCDDDSDGLCNEEYGGVVGVDDDMDGNEDATRAIPGFGNCNDGIDNDADTSVDGNDASCAPYIDEDTGISLSEDDDGDCVGSPPADPFESPFCSVAGGIDEDGPDICPLAGYLVKFSKLGGPGGLIVGVPNVGPDPGPDVVWTVVGQDCVSRALYSSEDPGEVDVEALLVDGDLNPINKHAFLVWYLKIYQVKLTNVPLADNVGREFHNAGVWQGEDPVAAAGVTQETLNVSQDALARVQVKGWFRTADPSGRGSVCIDMDGDGDGSEPGEPYPATFGCADASDELLDHGYWVLPDDIEALAGPDPSRLAGWDVMSEPDVAADDLIGYKSTLDSHDDVLRRVVDCVVLRVTPEGQVVPDYECMRKTVDPDGQITAADAIMPPLRILARIIDDGDGMVEIGESGFLKAADKDIDLNIESAYSRAEIPASPWIPAFVGNGGYSWDSWGFNGPAQGPYSFFEILTKHEEFDDENRPYIRSFQFYTDNRGLGYFFANGDYKLTFDECPMQQLSGTPECSPRDLVGKSVVTVIGDYPYFRKHPAVESNPVEKTWTWGGFTSVTAEKLDATHTVIIAHLKDRDGYCKWDVGADPTQADSVIFSPSLNEVQHEWIEFLLNTDVGFPRDVSPNALYVGDVQDIHSLIDMGLPAREVVKIRDHISSPLAEERSIGLEPNMGRIWEAERQVVARAEDVRVLAFYGESAAVDPKYTDPTAPDECQAWIVLEHPAELTPNVSVVFHNPEGYIDLHYPTSQFVSVLVPGWNDSCYTGPQMDIEHALMDAGLIEEDGTSHVLAAYRFTNDERQVFDHWFPGHPEVEDTLTTIAPYDQLFLLLDQPMTWTMDVVADTTGHKDERVSLIQGWNSVCYAGTDNGPDQATASIQGDFPVLYSVASDQTWRRYVPDYPWATNIVTLNRYTSVSMPVTAPGGATWVFDALPAPNPPSSAPPEATSQPEPNAAPLEIPSLGETCAPVLPATYLGTVTVDGVPAADGTVVRTSIGGIEWANATTSGGLYVFDVPAALPAAPPCFSGGQITFTCDSVAAVETATWNSGLHELNLSCGEVATKVRVGSGQAPLGAQVTVPLEAVSVPAPGLGAFTVDIAYEAGVVAPTDYVGDPGDRFDSVLCNLNYSPNTVRCSGVRTAPGVVGDLALADITFEVAPTALLGHQSPLALTVQTFADVEGIPIPNGTQDGSIRVGLVGNVDCDSDVDAVDALFILQHVVGLRSASNQCPLAAGTLYLPGADAQCDDDVDAVDALFVLQHVVGLRPVLCPDS